MKTVLILLALVLGACNSPRNNRVQDLNVEEQGGTSSKVFVKTGLNLQIQWVKGPFGASTRESELMVVVTNQEEARVSVDGELGFYAWMPSMGHPLEDAGFFEELETGIYINSHIKFNMAGDWEMSLQDLDENFDIKDEVKWLDFL